MRSLLTGLVALSVLLCAAIASPLPASDRGERPTATIIEELIRDSLAKRADKPRSLIPYLDARLTDVDFVSSDRLSASQWYVEIDATFDLGPPPKSVLGFLRHRSSRYQLFVKHHDGGWELLRFNPKGQVHPLPAAN